MMSAMSTPPTNTTPTGDLLASPSDFDSALRESLKRMAKVSDRTPPVVFAGREDEIELLDTVSGVQQGEVGHTVVMQGLPGVGKTALLEQYAARVLDDPPREDLVVPVQIGHEDLDMPPMALVRLIDASFLDNDVQGKWQRRLNRVLEKGAILGDMALAAVTKHTFDDFKHSKDAQDSLRLALDEYAEFRLGTTKATFLLMLDEAQNLPETPRAKAYLSAIHRGMKGKAKVALACFGLPNTVHKLRDLGLSRLASDHVKTLGTLSDDEAESAVRKTLEHGLAHFTFDEGPFDEDERSRWIGIATDAVLENNANFPQHLANGCKALASILLDEGISREPPVDRVRELCTERRAEYYDARLNKWRHHKTALAYGFGTGDDFSANVADIERALRAADERGRPVELEKARSVLDAMEEAGLIEFEAGDCRLAVPSMATYFGDIRSNDSSPVVKTLKAALSSDQQSDLGQGPMH